MNTQKQENTISKNFIFNLIKTITSMLFPVITFAYASRILSVDGIGKVNFAKSIMIYFSMFAQLGTVAYGTREAAKIRDDKEKLGKFVQEMIWINLCSTAIAYIVFFFCLVLIPQFFAYRQLLLIYSLTIFLNALGLEWLYSALEEYKYIAKRTVLFQAISLLFLFLMVRSEDDAAWYALILVFAASGSYAVNFIHAKKIVVLHRQKHYEIKKHMKPILILFGFSASVNIYTTLDVSMLGFISGDTAVGLYAAGEKVNKLVNTIIMSLGTVLMPRLSYYLEAGSKDKFYGLVDKAYKFIFMFSVPAFIGLFMLSEEIILLFCGEGFYQATITMQLLTPIVLVIPFSVMTNNQILIPMRREKLILISTCVGAVVNLICNSLLIPGFGENGAALGTVMAETAVMFVCIYNARRFFDIKRIFGGIWKYWLAALPIIAARIVIGKLHLGAVLTISLTMILGAGIYFGLLYLFKDSIVLEMIRRGLGLLKKDRRGA